MPGKKRPARQGNAATTGGIWSMLVLLMMFTPGVWADVQASLDRTTVHAGDTVTLTLEADGQNPGVSPDLSALEKDFTILGTSTSQQVQIINGRRSDRTQWHVELDPGHTGSLEIPALRVGNETTRPLSLKVVEQPEAVSGQEARPLFMEVETEPEDASPFVQQQIRYTTRLYYRVPLIEGTLADPQPNNAVVERLGDDTHYTTTIGGQRYQVVERHYAVFAEKSGTLTLPPVSFTGRVPSESDRRSPRSPMGTMMEQFFGGDPFFDNGLFGGRLLGDPGKRVRARSPALTLDVRPRPAAYTGTNWLPSEELVLRDSWAESPPEFRVGEPVTRTLTLEAKGLAASQLPVIPIPEMSGMRVYPEQPVRESRSDGRWVYGHSEQSLALVPSAAGKLSVPEIRLAWWDVRANEQRVAVLPAWEVNVLPGAGGSVSGAVPPQPAAAADEPGDAAAPGAPPVAAAGWTDIPRIWWLWLAAAAVLTVAGTRLALRPSRRERREPPVPGQVAATASKAVADVPRAGEARRDLQAACAKNDPNAAARALLVWAAAEWPDHPPRSLGAIATRLASGADAVRALDQALYAPGDLAWDGAGFWDIFRQGLQAKTAAAADRDGGLAPLYPH
jgi:hypothetical protein